jgi:uncharacterized membrane protein YdjX (TVP38/TMEM64 family)
MRGLLLVAVSRPWVITVFAAVMFFFGYHRVSGYPQWGSSPTASHAGMSWEPWWSGVIARCGCS